MRELSRKALGPPPAPCCFYVAGAIPLTSRAPGPGSAVALTAGCPSRQRNGQPVAAVVPIEDFNALEDAIDRYFAREADRDVTENPDAPTSSMSAVVAAIFEEETGKGVA
jgi:hypothetical protein